MAALDHFILSPDQYTRDLDIIKTWLHHNATNLVKREGADYEKAIEFCKKLIAKDGKFPIQNPTVTIIDKDKNGDRQVRKTKYLAYLANIAKNNLICSPSMTTYVQPSVRQSMLGLYINQNLGLRTKAKEEQIQAELSGNEDLAKIKFNEQTSHKIFNNGISGAQSIGSTPLVLVSAHSTLTSGCAAATSIANASIEKFIAGSRHYFNAEAVRTNILSIITNFDRDHTRRVVEKYNLKIPTLQDLHNVVARSTVNYWHDDAEMEDIVELLSTLDDMERVAFAYIGDFYHVRELNPKFVKSMLDEIGETQDKCEGDPITTIKEMDGDHQVLAFMLCAEVTAGKSKKDVIKENDPTTTTMLAGTYRHMIDTLDKYDDFIKAFWVTRNLPANISRGRDIVRRAVVGSDTDSCLFTCSDWVKWRHGRIKFDWKTQAIWHTMVFIMCQIISHNLALLAGGQGVTREYQPRLAMKNEFAFSVFGLTNIAKHYYAHQLAKEGGVFKKPKLEIKGVQFKDSNSPPALIQMNENLIVEVMDQIYRDGQFDLKPILTKMADEERSVQKSIENAEPRFLKALNIKNKKEYKKPESSPYKYHEIWEEAFAKYGVPTIFPYRAARISMELDNKTQIKEWVESIEDPVCRNALKKRFVDAGVNAVSSIVMPLESIRQHGIPKEILQGVSMRTQIYRACRPFYLTLDSMRMNYVNKKLTRMVHDDF